MSAATWVGVAMLGGVGAVLRLLVSSRLNKGRSAADWPIGTLFVNLSGAFLLGVLSGLDPRWHAPAVLAVGLLGAYTTFSTWMIEAAGLAESGRRGRAATYLVGSLVLGVGAVWLGHAVGAALA